MKFDVVVIGGGPSGLCAGIYAKRAGKSIAILEKYIAGGQLNQIDKIDNYLGFSKIDGMTLAQDFERHANDVGVQFIYDEVLNVDFDGDEKTIICRNSTILAKSVILATGSSPRKLNIDGEEEFLGKGVSYCAVCDGNFFKGKDVAVVGSGDSAFSEALYLSSLCNKVFLLTKSYLKMHNYTFDEISKRHNIMILNDAISQKIEGENVVEKLIYTKDEKLEEIPVSAVFVAIGREPNTEFLKQKITLNEKGFVIVDENMQTNIEGVFACGDVRNSKLKQVTTAVSDGAIAGVSACKYVDSLV